MNCLENVVNFQIDLYLSGFSDHAVVCPKLVFNSSDSIEQDNVSMDSIFDVRNNHSLVK